MSRVQLKDGYCGKQKVLVFAEETRWQLSDLMVQERQRLLKKLCMGILVFHYRHLSKSVILAKK